MTKKSIRKELERIRDNNMGDLNQKDHEIVVNAYHKYVENIDDIKFTVNDTDHPRWKNKKPTLCFYIQIRDQPAHRISVKSILGNKKSFSEQLAEAFRNEIEDQILQFAQKNQSKIGQDHVDHKMPPFCVLYKQFLADHFNSKNIRSIIITKNKKLQDNELAKSWQNWHKYHAQLQIVSKQNNLGKKDLCLNCTQNGQIRHHHYVIFVALEPCKNPSIVQNVTLKNS